MDGRTNVRQSIFSKVLSPREAKLPRGRGTINTNFAKQNAFILGTRGSMWMAELR